MKVMIRGRPVWLNFHHLYYFQTIANTGSISGAAKILKLGQPTLSAQLKALEDQLGIRLFDRQHKRIHLTEAGRIALEYANELFRVGSEFVEVLHDQVIPTRTHVQIGALDSVPKHLILNLVQQTLSLGQCTISILEGHDDELIRALANYKIDLMLSNFKPQVGGTQKLYAKRIAQVPVMVAGAPSYKHLKKGFPKSVHQAPFVLPTSHSKLRSDIDHFFRLCGVQVDPLVETQDTSVLKMLGINGTGLIVASEFALKEMIEAGNLVGLGILDGVFEEYFLVSSSRKIENPISSRISKSFQLNK